MFVYKKTYLVLDNFLSFLTQFMINVELKVPIFFELSNDFIGLIVQH